MHPRSFAALALVVLAAPSALAQTAPEPATIPPPPPPPAAPVEPHHAVSVTFSPIHLFLPIVEVAGEVALNEKMSVAGIVGFGSVPIETTTITSSAGGLSSSTKRERLSAWEVGGHFNYYVLGNFDHGMQLGVEALYLKVDAAGTTYRSAASASGFAVGPYVGYKLITGVGFTFEANLGAQYVAARAQTSDGTSSASDSKWIPLLNLNVGWSF